MGGILQYAPLVSSLVTTISTAGGAAAADVWAYSNRTLTDDTSVVDNIEAKLLEIWRLMGLDAANIASITDTSITVGSITITIGQPNADTTTLTRS